MDGELEKLSLLDLMRIHAASEEEILPTDPLSPQEFEEQIRSAEGIEAVLHGASGPGEAHHGGLRNG